MPKFDFSLYQQTCNTLPATIKTLSTSINKFLSTLGANKKSILNIDVNFSILLLEEKGRIFPVIFLKNMELGSGAEFSVNVGIPIKMHDHSFEIDYQHPVAIRHNTVKNTGRNKTKLDQIETALRLYYRECPSLNIIDNSGNIKFYTKIPLIIGQELFDLFEQKDISLERRVYYAISLLNAYQTEFIARDLVHGDLTGPNIMILQPVL